MDDRQWDEFELLNVQVLVNREGFIQTLQLGVSAQQQGGGYLVSVFTKKFGPPRSSQHQNFLWEGQKFQVMARHTGGAGGGRGWHVVILDKAAQAQAQQRHKERVEAQEKKSQAAPKK